MWALCTAQRKGGPYARCPLANATDLLTPSPLNYGRLVGQNYGPIFSPFNSPDYVSRRGRDRSLQRRFPIVDILLRSGDIRDRSAKSSEIAPKRMFFGPIFLGGRTPNFGPGFKSAPISDHVAKFCGDRLRDCGDLALKKKERNSNKT